MPRTLSASDRASLIRLASLLPEGSGERKALLSVTAGWIPPEVRSKLSPKALEKHSVVNRSISQLEGILTFFRDPSRDIENWGLGSPGSASRLEDKALQQIEGLRDTLVELRRVLAIPQR